MAEIANLPLTLDQARLAFRELKRAAVHQAGNDSARELWGLARRVAALIEAQEQRKEPAA